MFYAENQIQSLLDCQVCEAKFEDPRILSCGISYCSKCILSMLTTDKRRIKCKNCAKTHEVPEDGFPPNLVAVKFLQLKANEVIQSKLVDDIKTIANYIKEYVAKITVFNSNSETLIREHCGKVKTDVHLTIKEAHLKLEKIGVDLLKKIDSEEIKYVQQITSVRSNNEEIKKVIEKVEAFDARKNNLLNRFRINETDLRNLLNEATYLQVSLETCFANIQGDPFSKKLVFEKASLEIDSSIIGKLKYQDSRIEFAKNENKFQVIDFCSKLNSVLEEDDTHFLSDLQAFNDNSLVLVYFNKQRNLNIACLDLKGNVLKENNNLIINGNFNTIKDVAISTAKDTTNTWVYIFTEEKNQSGDQFRLMTVDENFNFFKQVMLSQKIDFMDSNGENLFAVHGQNKKFNLITVYNKNLEITNKIGQNFSRRPFYFPYPMDSFMLNNDFFFINGT